MWACWPVGRIPAAHVGKAWVMPVVTDLVFALIKLGGSDVDPAFESATPCAQKMNPCGRSIATFEIEMIRAMP